MIVSDRSGEAQRDAAPPIAFLHLPRTGGRSFTRSLLHKYGKDAAHRFHLLRAPTAEEAAAISPGARLIYGHMCYGLHINKPVRYITILREPVSRTISTFRLYCFKNPTYSHQELLLSFLDTILVSNVQARMLAGSLESGADGDDLYRLARSNLMEFRLVGVFERLPTFAAALKLPELPHIVESRNEFELPSWWLKEINSRNDVDSRLHNFVNKRYAAGAQRFF